MRFALVLLTTAATCVAIKMDPTYGNTMDPVFPYDFGLNKPKTDLQKKEEEKVAKVVKEVSKRSPKEQTPVVDDYEKAEGSIFHAVETAEKAVLHGIENMEHAVEGALRDEVDTMFHELPKHEMDEGMDVKKAMKKPAFSRGRGKDGANKKEVEEVVHHTRHFKEGVKDALNSMLEGNME